MKRRRLQQSNQAKPRVKRQSASSSQSPAMTTDIALKQAELLPASQLKPQIIQHLQGKMGNKAAQDFLSKNARIQRQEAGTANKEKSLLESIGDAIMESPQLLANQAESYANRVGPIVSNMANANPNDPYIEPVNNIYWGFFGLVAKLKKMKQSDKTTAQQRQQYMSLVKRWGNVQAQMEASRCARIKAELAKSRARVEQLMQEILVMYHSIYSSGGTDETRIAISKTGKDTITPRALGGYVVSMLNAINNADAAINSRSVSVLVPFMRHTMTFLNVILTMDVPPALASESRIAMGQLKNAVAIGLAAASFTAASKFLPMFSHIPMVLGAIAGQWSKIESKLREQNDTWWKLGFNINPDVEPGGRPVWNYMNMLFLAPNAEALPDPSDEVVKYFSERRDMFDSANVNVMGGEKMPTESSMLFWTVVDKKKLNDYAYYNRKTMWTLLYGKREFPDKRKKR